MDKPFSAACERNREPIADVLRRHLGTCRQVLEIGSGTGQHAVHFAQALPHLRWQSSDRAVCQPGIRQWLDEAALPNTPAPLCLDVNTDWPPLPGLEAGAERGIDAIFTANTLHIMSWPEVAALFGKLAGFGSDSHPLRLVIYGPFKYGGRHTSASNAQFEQSLQASAPHRAIRDIEAVSALATAGGFRLLEDAAMPAHNRCLVWVREPAAPHPTAS